MIESLRLDLRCREGVEQDTLTGRLQSAAGASLDSSEEDAMRLLRQIILFYRRARLQHRRIRHSDLDGHK